VVELGTGDASAVAGVVAGLPGLTVRSWDVDADSVSAARAVVAERGVADRYTVEHGDFFAGAAGSPARTVITNPPYLPAPDGDLELPGLWGGPDGNALLVRLLGGPWENVVAAVASYADPVGTLEAAADAGYRVTSFLAMPLELGRYSREPKVLDRIRDLVAADRGWADDDSYMVAVALFTRSPLLRVDRSAELAGALQLGVPALAA
ncbi:DNA methylase, N-6 adenine-specific, partial [Klenkia terrae]